MNAQYLDRQALRALQPSGAGSSLRVFELVARDKASLDIFWLRDESLEDTDNLPAPEHATAVVTPRSK